MSVVEALDVALADGSHRHGQHLWLGRRQKESVGFVQQLAVLVAVFVVDENGSEVDAALGDVERNVWQDQTLRGAAWRQMEVGASSVSAGGAAGNQESDARRVGNILFNCLRPLKVATLVIRFASLTLVTFLASCGGNGQSSEDFSAYRKNPQTCSADSYFAELTESERLHYVFGALHVRPQAACIAELLARQDFRFLSVLQDEIKRRDGIYDRYTFIDAVVIKRNSGGLSEAELQELGLDKFCVEVDASSNKCPHLLRQLQIP